VDPVGSATVDAVVLDELLVVVLLVVLLWVVVVRDQDGVVEYSCPFVVVGRCPMPWDPDQPGVLEAVVSSDDVLCVVLEVELLLVVLLVRGLLVVLL
jgi:hypothetical protein